MISADAFLGAGSQPGSAALGQVSATSACSFARVPTPGVGSPAGGPLAAGPSGLSECSQEYPRSERRRGHSYSGEGSYSSKKCRRDGSPPPSRSSCVSRSSASSSSASSDGGV